CPRRRDRGGGSVVRQDARLGKMGHRGRRPDGGCRTQPYAARARSRVFTRGNLPCRFVGYDNTWLPHDDENIFVDGRRGKTERTSVRKLASSCGAKIPRESI